MRISLLIVAVLFCAPAAGLDLPRPPGNDTTAPPCSIKKLTPAYTKSLAADVLKSTAIVASTSYYTVPCFRATVDFFIAPKTSSPLPYEDFYFDSISNELIDTKTKCETYRQSTEIYRMESDGDWSQKDKGRLIGNWSGGKCKFKAPAGQSDFRSKKYSPVFTQQSHFRVVSTVTTGSGIVWGPNNQPNQTGVAEVKARGKATPRQVCFAVEHPHPDNTPVEGCADPTR